MKIFHFENGGTGFFAFNSTLKVKMLPKKKKVIYKLVIEIYKLCIFLQMVWNSPDYFAYFVWCFNHCLCDILHLSNREVSEKITGNWPIILNNP